MTEGSRPNNTRGRPFKKGSSGNPSGRPLGARNRTTLAVQALLDGEAEELTRKAIELALGGDLNALRLCLERVIPPVRGRPVQFEITDLKSIDDAPDAVASVVAAAGAGQITVSEATELGRLIELYVRTCEVSSRSKQREAIFAITTLDPKRLTPKQFTTLFDCSKFTDDQLEAILNNLPDGVRKDVEEYAEKISKRMTNGQAPTTSD